VLYCCPILLPLESFVVCIVRVWRKTPSTHVAFSITYSRGKGWVSLPKVTFQFVIAFDKSFIKWIRCALNHLKISYVFYANKIVLSLDVPTLLYQKNPTILIPIFRLNKQQQLQVTLPQSIHLSHSYTSKWNLQPLKSILIYNLFIDSARS